MITLNYVKIKIRKCVLFCPLALAGEKSCCPWETFKEKQKKLLLAVAADDTEWRPHDEEENSRFVRP